MRMTASHAAACLGLALGAGLAQGQIEQASGISVNATPTLASPATESFVHLFDVAGAVHNNTQGSVWNHVLGADLGEDQRLVGLGWDLDASSQQTMPLSGLKIAIVNADGDGVIIDPFSGQNQIGPGQASFAIHDLTLDGMDVVLTGGEVFIEFFADANLFAGPEGWHAAGSQLTLRTAAIPSPGALAMLGVGGLVATRRRR